MSIQIVHCSDLHLDKNFHISSIARSYERREDLNRNFAKIVEFAVRHRPDLFLVSGDIFDRLLPSNFSRVFVTRMVKELSDQNIPVFMIGGNHDAPRIAEYTQLAIDVLETAGLATVFSRSDKLQKKMLQIAGKTVCISGKSYYAKYETRNPLEGENIPLSGHYNILLLHGSLQGMGITPTIPEMAYQNPFHPEDIKRGLNYLALGHYHNSFHKEHNGCLICNPGSIERLSWAEINDEKGFFWVELKDREASPEFIRLETRPMGQEEIILSRALGEDLLRIIKEFLSQHQDEKKIFQLKMKGTISQSQYVKMKLNEIYRACSDMFFHLVLDRGELEVEGYGRTFFERIENPIEAYISRMNKLIGKTQDEVTRKVLQEARELGVKYLEAMR